MDSQSQQSINVLNDNRFVFGNFGGLVSPNYVKYFNLIALELICILIFTVVYFFVLISYDKYLIVFDQYPKNYVTLITIWRALLLAINYQAAANYTPITFKHIFPQTIITIQLTITVALAFLFLTV